jgi:hypothetical protein
MATGFLLTEFIPLPAVSQQADETMLAKSKEIAKQQIKNLKNGALLVRLMTKSNSISALRARGDNYTADKIEKKQTEINVRIVTAFRVEFDFCPVYFFYSDYTQFVKDKQLDGVVFVNDSLQPDSSIKLNSENFLIAEFGNVLMESGKHHDGYYYYKDKTTDSLKKSDYYSARSGFPAVIIKDDQFIQMRFSGFPFYARTLAGMRNHRNAVAVINRKLHRFYELVSILPSSQ